MKTPQTPLYSDVRRGHCAWMNGPLPTRVQACRAGLLAALLSMLVFAPLAFGAVDEWAFLVLQGLGVLFMLLWVWRLWLDADLKLRWPPLAWAVVLFVIYAVARYLTADIELTARGEVIQVVLFATVFWVVASDLHHRMDAWVIVLGVTAVAVAISGYAIFQMLTHSERVWNVDSGYPGRAGGTFISPNDLAGMLGLALPMALALMLSAKMPWWGRVTLGMGAACMMAGLAATFSRAGWFASVTGIVWMLALMTLHRKHRLAAITCLAAMLIGGGFFVSHYLAKNQTFQARISGKGSGGQGVLDFDTRFALWRAAEAMWLDHFWIGVGPAHFDARFPAYRPASIQKRPNRAHNDYLNLLADWGALGGLLVLGGAVTMAWGWLRAWPLIRECHDVAEQPGILPEGQMYPIFLGATGGLTSLMVHSMFDFNLHIPANALIGVTWLALLSSVSGDVVPGGWRKVNRPMLWPVTGVIGAVVLCLLVDGWRRGHEVYWMARANEADVFAPNRAVLLEKAYQAEPRDFDVAYNLGETLRMRSFQGGDDYARLAREAMVWYARTVDLNPYDGYGYLRYGMCLDWLGNVSASKYYYQRAEELDWNGYFMVANIGWHYVQSGDYALGREYFMRSMGLSNESAFAGNYLAICEEKLRDKASGKWVFP